MQSRGEPSLDRRLKKPVTSEIALATRSILKLTELQSVCGPTTEPIRRYDYCLGFSFGFGFGGTVVKSTRSTTDKPNSFLEERIYGSQPTVKTDWYFESRLGCFAMVAIRRYTNKGSPRAP